MSDIRQQAQEQIDGLIVAQMIIEFQREFRHIYGIETRTSSLCAVGPLHSMIGLAIKNGRLVVGPTAGSSLNPTT